ALAPHPHARQLEHAVDGCRTLGDSFHFSAFLCPEPGAYLARNSQADCLAFSRSALRAQLTRAESFFKYSLAVDPFTRVGTEMARLSKSSKERMARFFSVTWISILASSNRPTTAKLAIMPMESPLACSSEESGRRRWLSSCHLHRPPPSGLR